MRDKVKMLFSLILLSAVSVAAGYWLGVVHTAHHVLEVTR